MKQASLIDVQEQLVKPLALRKPHPTNQSSLWIVTISDWSFFSSLTAGKSNLLYSLWFMLVEYLTIHNTWTANVANRMETLSGNERTENWYLSCRHYHYILHSGSTIITIQCEQVCIPVGCVPPACCPYPLVFGWGVSAQGGVSARRGGCLPSGCLPRGPGGGGGVCLGGVFQHTMGQTPPCEQNHRQV